MASVRREMRGHAVLVRMAKASRPFDMFYWWRMPWSMEIGTSTSWPTARPTLRESSYRRSSGW